MTAQYDGDWRPLAEPLYGVEEFGVCAELPADTLVRIPPGVVDPDPLSGIGTKLTHDASTIVIEAGPNSSIYGPITRWHVTASALPFEGSAR